MALFTSVLFAIVRRIHRDFVINVNNVNMVVITLNDRIISADYLQIGVTAGRCISCVDYGRLQSWWLLLNIIITVTADLR